MSALRQPRRDIISALADRLSAAEPGSPAAGRLAEEIAAYLLSTGRTGELNSLLRDIMSYRAERGTVEVTAVSAFPLDGKVKGDVEAEVRRLYPDVRQIIVSQRHDPDVVAGVRLEFADKQHDLSVRNKLNRLKQLAAVR